MRPPESQTPPGMSRRGENSTCRMIGWRRSGEKLQKSPRTGKRRSIAEAGNAVGPS